MKVTATQLVTYWTCPFLWHVSYEVKEPLPVWGTRRRFGNVVHAAIAEYERGGGSLERARSVLEDRSAGLSEEDLAEAREILEWRHQRTPVRRGRPILIEGSLRSYLGGHRLEVRMDRLDGEGSGFLLAEYKGGKSVDLELVRVQLLILSYAVLDVFGRAPDRWELELLRARKVLSLEAETSPRELRAFAGGLIEGVLSGDREPRPFQPAFCRRCPARGFCPKGSPNPRPLTRNVPQASAQPGLF